MAGDCSNLPGEEGEERDKQSNAEFLTTNAECLTGDVDKERQSPWTEAHSRDMPKNIPELPRDIGL
jgi:hypothetical protein